MCMTALNREVCGWIVRISPRSEAEPRAGTIREGCGSVGVIKGGLLARTGKVEPWYRGD